MVCRILLRSMRSNALVLLIDSVVARGTGEPGTFGVIAGDQLVAAVTKALPDARGYAVQVSLSIELQELLLRS